MTAQAWILLGFLVLVLLLSSYEIARLQRIQQEMFNEAVLMNLRWRLVADITSLRAIRGAATGELGWGPEDQRLLRAKLQTLKDTGISLTDLGIEDESPPSAGRTEVN